MEMQDPKNRQKSPSCFILFLFSMSDEAGSWEGSLAQQAYTNLNLQWLLL